MPSVLFICTANICRSPMAEGALRAILAATGVDLSRVHIESAATHDYQVGQPPFELAAEAAKRRGYEIGQCVSRLLSPADFDRFDYILAMDRSNLRHLHSICPSRCKQKVELLMEYGDRYHGMEVPDPYGGRPEDFERVMDLIEDGCRGLATLVSRAA